MAIIEAAAAAATVAETLKFLRSLGNKIPPEALDALTDAYSHALTSQQEQLDLIKRVQELEGTIAEYDNWETEKDRYELHEIMRGSFAYRLSEESTEPEHFICPNCYEDRQKSILQIDAVFVHATRKLSCSRCGMHIYCHNQDRQSEFRWRH